jgi:hypothetical protein
MRTGYRRFVNLAAAAIVALLVAAPSPAEQRSLLTPDGTLFEVQSGYYRDLRPEGREAQPGDYVIAWSANGQSGVTLAGIIPGTDTPDVKDQFDMAYDGTSKTLIVVWNNRYAVINSIQFAIYHDGGWTKSELLPSAVFTYATHPKIVVTHQTVRTLDANGNEVDTPRSIASVVWWEGSSSPRARFAPIFIENGSIDLTDLTVYDLPDLIGSGPPDASLDVSNPVFKNPSVQAEGFSSAVLASFGDASDGSLQVARIDFPSDFRDPADLSRGRHVIVILGHRGSPMTPAVPSGAGRVGTVVGGNYEPTVYWQTGDSSVQYTMFDGAQWSDTRTVAVTPSRPTDAAISLIRAMALQN